MLRIIFVILLIVLAYRFYQRLKGISRRMMGNTPRGRFDRQKPFSHPPSQHKVIDEMKPCAQCGIYLPLRSSLHKNGLYFCNSRCHENYRKRQPTH